MHGAAIDDARLFDDEVGNAFTGCIGAIEIPLSTQRKP